MTLSREAFLNTKIEVPLNKVDIPELGGSVYVKGMTAKERSAFEVSLQTNGKRSLRKMQLFREMLVVKCCCDEQGTKLFTKEDMSTIGDLPITVVERIVDECMLVCGMKDEDVEGMVGNSDDSLNGS